MSNEKNIKYLNGETITASEYYYGVKPDYWDKMSYPEAIKSRAELAKKLYFELYKLQEKSPTELPWDDKVRLYKVEKAVKDTRQLLEERDLII